MPRLSSAPVVFWALVRTDLHSYVKLDRSVFLSGHVTSPITLGLAMLI